MARGDVLYVTLPESQGREQSGRRPVVAVQTDVAGEPLLMIAPTTSNLKAARFAFTVRLEPSEENGLSAPSVVMVFQMRAIDKTRIIRKIGQLSKEEMKQVDKAIWEMLKPPDIESET
jgi:mRNA interferase MazF